MYDDVWFSLAVPVLKEDYGRDKKHWSKLMEGHMQYYYKKFHGKDPIYSKEFGQKVDVDSQRQRLTRERKNQINLMEWAEDGRSNVGV